MTEKAKIEKAGIYEMTKEEYHADPCVEPSLSRSCITTLITKSPFHAMSFHPRLGGKVEEVEGEESAACKLGDLVDELLLGGTRKISVAPFDDFRTKDARAWRDAEIAAGNLFCKQAVYNRAVDMIESFRLRMSLKNFPNMGEEFPTGNFQRVFIWHEGGVWNRALLDTYQLHIWDLKTTAADASPGAWIRNQLFKMTLEHQEAYYRRGFKVVTGKEKYFLFAVLEQQEPFDCYPVALDPADNDRANQQISYAQRKWREGLDTGHWPGYAAGVVHASAPPYINTQWEEFKEREKTVAEIRERQEKIDPAKALHAC